MMNNVDHVHQSDPRSVQSVLTNPINDKVLPQFILLNQIIASVVYPLHYLSPLIGPRSPEQYLTLYQTNLCLEV